MSHSVHSRDLKTGSRLRRRPFLPLPSNSAPYPPSGDTDWPKRDLGSTKAVSTQNSFLSHSELLRGSKMEERSYYFSKISSND